jgi:hypothetical protein
MNTPNCTTDADCKQKCKDLGGLSTKTAAKRCIRYKVLTRMCVTIDFVETERGANKYIIFGEGGCFGGREVGHYEFVKPNKQYKFERVPLEIRSKYDPYVVWARHGYKLGENKPVLMTVCYVFLGLAFVLGLARFLLPDNSHHHHHDEEEMVKL